MPKILFAATHKDSCDQSKLLALKTKFIETVQQMFSTYEKKSHMVLETVYFIDARDPKDPEIKEMTDKVVCFAMQQSTWGKWRPMLWVPLEIQISNMRSKSINLINKGQLEQVNKLNGDLALDEDQLVYFLLAHHSLGKLIYYDLPGLNQFIVIHPPALVNILRAFITDDMFWSEETNLQKILQTLRKSGKIYKKDLLLLWEQHECQQYIKDNKTKDFLICLFAHLDILVVPKGINRSPPAADFYLVPCMVNADCPVDFIDFHELSNKTICLIYSLSMQSIPTSLAYKIIGGAAGIWPFKEDEDGKPCLYQKAAILHAGDDMELRVHLEDKRIMVYLSNKETIDYISPDIAASIQECLTQTLESSLLFYYNSFGKKKTQTDVKKLFELSGGLLCNNSVCHLALSEAKYSVSWKCSHRLEHDRKYLLKWYFDKEQKTCTTDCRGPDETMLHKVPNDKHLMRLTSEIDIHMFEKVLRQLDYTENIIKEWRRIEYQFSSTHNLLSIMFMALHYWREKKNSDLENPALFDINKALSTTNVNKHSICQIFREDTTLHDVADSLHDIPSDDVLKEVAQRIGNRAIQLGIELGLSFNELQESMVEYSRNMFDQTYDILRKWKANSSVKTVYSLVVALKRVAPSCANYLREKFVR
ncbi:uncharacterized protein LOC127732814 isoform X7 [Mytilus californianus]|uniref:uncharacterized protein LOC127732814 isoform X4 n=1 Tax=Mytilus californianus TaxID=6549 RepID=UPI0022457659|nr:uncharacterized protein LOC127732814 isoform X4 [Mytilus californianus]XP_052097947.1 uncharacterized protein LOC127732814 isoform X7 [Mytilus californianus]